METRQRSSTSANLLTVPSGSHAKRQRAATAVNFQKSSPVSSPIEEQQEASTEPIWADEIASGSTLYARVPFPTDPTKILYIARSQMPVSGLSNINVDDPMHLALLWRAKWDANKARPYYILCGGDKVKAWRLPDLDGGTASVSSGGNRTPPPEAQMSFFLEVDRASEANPTKTGKSRATASFRSNRSDISGIAESVASNAMTILPIIQLEAQEDEAREHILLDAQETWERIVEESKDSMTEAEEATSKYFEFSQLSEPIKIAIMELVHVDEPKSRTCVESERQEAFFCLVTDQRVAVQHLRQSMREYHLHREREFEERRFTELNEAEWREDIRNEERTEWILINRKIHLSERMVLHLQALRMEEEESRSIVIHISDRLIDEMRGNFFEQQQEIARHDRARGGHFAKQQRQVNALWLAEEYHRASLERLEAVERIQYHTLEGKAIAELADAGLGAKGKDIRSFSSLPFESHDDTCNSLISFRWQANYPVHAIQELLTHATLGTCALFADFCLGLSRLYQQMISALWMDERGRSIRFRSLTLPQIASDYFERAFFSFSALKSLAEKDKPLGAIDPIGQDQDASQQKGPMASKFEVSKDAMSAMREKIRKEEEAKSIEIKKFELKNKVEQWKLKAPPVRLSFDPIVPGSEAFIQPLHPGKVPERTYRWDMSSHLSGMSQTPSVMAERCEMQYPGDSVKKGKREHSTSSSLFQVDAPMSEFQRQMEMLRYSHDRSAERHALRLGCYRDRIFVTPPLPLGIPKAGEMYEEVPEQFDEMSPAPAPPLGASPIPKVEEITNVSSQPTLGWDPNRCQDIALSEDRCVAQAHPASLDGPASPPLMMVFGSQGVSEGLFVWEVTLNFASTAQVASQLPLVGMASRLFWSKMKKGSQFPQDQEFPAYFYRGDGSLCCLANGNDATSFGRRLRSGSRLTLRLDLAALELGFFVDGLFQGVGFRFEPVPDPEPLFPIVIFGNVGDCATLHPPTAPSTIL